MGPRLPGFHGEYLWEIGIARRQLLALAEAAPEEIYGWSPADGARPFSAVLVHIATVNLTLLRLAETPALRDDLGAMVHRNFALEQTVTAKQEVAGLLRQSFDAVEQSLSALSHEQLEKADDLFGERSTIRRLYLRILAHSHEHMGQAIAYARVCGMKVPWPDPRREFES